MKKFKLLLLTVVSIIFCACHEDIWNAIDNLDARMTKLEALCKQMNTNIESLDAIVDVLLSHDFVTNLVEIKQDGNVIGFAITFGTHEPITIYYDKDEEVPTVPIVGIAKDSDGVYYWTLNGEWLKDDNGNKLPVSGYNGQNGTNGTDGITPQLKIEDGYWYVSYDNGSTWTQLEKATGDKGDQGDKGDKGDSMFQSITQDENYVYFTLADGTVITLPKDSQANSQFLFTITFNSNGGSGIMSPDTFYYGCSKTLKPCTFTKQGFMFKNWNTSSDGTGVAYSDQISLLIDRNITLYAQWMVEYVDLGLSTKWASCNLGAESPEAFGNYYAWAETVTKYSYYWSNYNYGNGFNNALTKYCNTSSSGVVDNKLILDVSDDAAQANWGDNWYMPTMTELQELCYNCTWTWTNQNGVAGYLVTGTNGNNIFLPAAGYINGDTHEEIGQTGLYWSTSLDTYDPIRAVTLWLEPNYQYFGNWGRCIGINIRPVYRGGDNENNDNNDDNGTPPPTEETVFAFSVSNTQQVAFSPGNLQYHPYNNQWRFALNQTDFIGEANRYISSYYNGWIDLFGWSGSSGYSFGVSNSTSESGYNGSFIDWGTNSIDEYSANTWRTLSKDEWKYLLEYRTNAGTLCGTAQVNGTNGLVILPDDWQNPGGVTFYSGFNGFENNQSFSTYQWSILEESGAVFLPVSGWRNGSYVYDMQTTGRYWSSTDMAGTYASYLYITSSDATLYNKYRYYGHSVRLVKDI